MNTTKPHFATSSAGTYPILVGIFVGLLIISNVSAPKIIALGPIPVDGGIFLFPFVYILGDVLAEVYGWKATRRAIVVAFAMSALAAVTFWVVILAPPGEAYPHQEALEAVLGPVPRIVLASLLGFLVGQLLNAYVLVWMKQRTREGKLWARLLGSTAVGEFADTLVFCTVAFAGIITGTDFIVYVAFGFFYKTLVEVVFLPLTYAVIRGVKRREPTYAGS